MMSNDDDHFTKMYHDKEYRVWKAGEYWYSRCEVYTFGPAEYQQVVKAAEASIDALNQLEQANATN